MRCLTDVHRTSHRIAHSSWYCISYCILFVVNDYIGIICRDVFSFSGEFGTTTVKLGGRYKSIRSMNYE